MTDKQIEAYRQRLSELTAQCSDEKPEPRIYNELKKLAREVGASTRVLWVESISSTIKTSEADTSELIRNIHQALQTATMVDMCKTASRNFWIAVVVAIAALLSAIAAWAAVVVTALIAFSTR